MGEGGIGEMTLNSSKYSKQMNDTSLSKQTKKNRTAHKNKN